MNRLYEAAKARIQKQSPPSPTTEWLQELEAAAHSEPEPQKSPKLRLDPDMPAHHRLTALQKDHIQRRLRGGEVIDPLQLVPNRPCKDERGLEEPLYALNYRMFTHRALNWAMKEDPTAVKEIFDLVKPYALWAYVHQLQNPAWSIPIPAVAREKIVKLCVIEPERGTQLKELRDLLHSTRALENLQCIEFFRKPRLVSESGRATRKFSHELAVEYGMRPRVRLFFRWAFAEDIDVHGEARKQHIGHVTEFTRESVPGGHDGPPGTREAAVEYQMFSMETFGGAMCIPHLMQ